MSKRKTKCHCTCRHRYRILLRAKPFVKEFINPESEIINISALYPLYIEKKAMKKEEYSVHMCLIEHMNLSNVNRNLEMLSRCQCCNRHQMKSI